MATIDKLDISVYNLYAMRTMMIEQINQQLHLEQAGSIPPQTTVLDLYPKLTELDLLLGIVPLHTPWAYFYPPPKFLAKRRSPFGFARILPSLGNQQQQDAEEERASSVECHTPEEEKEKQLIMSCFAQITKINGWLSHIVGRIGQFLQG